MLAAGICSLVLGGLAQSQEASSEKEAPPQKEASPEKARALLDQVKKSEQDREIAVKQTEIDRLKEDQSKTESDSKALQQTIDSTSGLMTDTGEHLATLTTESKRLEHELAVAEARINAEQVKIAGLRALTDAQGKSLSALARRTEEAAARSHVRTLELEILQAGQQVPAEGRETSQTELIKARKALAVAASKAESEEHLAHEAMKAATAKMTLAETRATTAQRLADNDLSLEPTVMTPKAKAKAPEKSAEKLAPIAAPPKPATSTGASAKPSAATGASKTKKTPASTTAPH